MMVKKKPEKFKKCVQKCLRYHVLAINKLTDAGMIFWEYGNNLQYEADQAGLPSYFLFRCIFCLNDTYVFEGVLQRLFIIPGNFCTKEFAWG